MARNNYQIWLVMTCLNDLDLRSVSAVGAPPLRLGHGTGATGRPWCFGPDSRRIAPASAVSGGCPLDDLDSDWTTSAACRTSDPDALFVQGAAQNRAKAICLACPVRTECLADALDNRIEFGVWGGMTERERRALLRRRPQVTSWRRLLETAREEYDVIDRPHQTSSTSA